MLDSITYGCTTLCQQAQLSKMWLCTELLHRISSSAFQSRGNRKLRGTAISARPSFVNKTWVANFVNIRRTVWSLTLGYGRTDIKRCDMLHSGVRRPSRSEILFKIKEVSSRNEQRLAEREVRVRETRTARTFATCLMEGAT